MLQDRQRRGDKPGAWRDAAEEQARQELGDTYELIDIGKPATIDGLIEELAIEERLDGLISKCLKQLLLVRASNPSHQRPLRRQRRKFRAREKQADHQRPLARARAAATRR